VALETFNDESEITVENGEYCAKHVLNTEDRCLLRKLMPSRVQISKKEMSVPIVKVLK